jgi:putative SOS response-associated peptidase YedK
MCGRYVTARAASDLVADFGARELVGEDTRPSWNVAPTQRVPIVTERLEKHTGEIVRRIETARWGLVPAWAKDPSVGSRAINARSETVLEKPTFRSAAVKRRAITPAMGYYEWQKEGSRKIPTYLHPGDEERPLAFASLFEFWRDKSVEDPDAHGAWLMTSTILTRPASDALGHIHDRSPLVLPEEMWAEWLDPELTEKSAIAGFIEQVPEPHLIPRVVGPEVGQVRNNGPELIQPAE